MSGKLFTIEEILTLLAETPPRIAEIAGRLPPDQLHAAPSPGEWCARDVLAHLLSCDDVWGNYMRKILAEDRPEYRAVNPRTWIKRTDYLEQDFQPLFQTINTHRADLLAVLKSLTPEGWARTATVIDMVGKKFERTVYYYAERLARHEQPHVRQIERIASTVRATQL